MAQPGQKSSVPPAQAIHHELRTAENSASYVLPRIRALKESNPHVALLDVGAGSGTISVTFAKVIPDGKVTAVDLKPDILLRAGAIADSEGVKNIEFQQADVYKLPFADDTFDVTHCHQVLTHLKAPADALREMLRVTKPGGLVAAREADYKSECWWPEIPGLAKFHNFIEEFLKLPGGTPTSGRQLLSWALKAGAKRDQVTLSFGTWIFGDQHEKTTWATAMAERCRAGAFRKIGVDAKLTTEEDLDEMAAAWEEWEKAEDATLAAMHGEIIIQK